MQDGMLTSPIYTYLLQLRGSHVVTDVTSYVMHRILIPSDNIIVPVFTLI